MGEFAAWALGLLLGLAYPKPLGSWGRAIRFVALTAALGTGITVLTGEWAQEPGFVLMDIGQVVLATSIGLFAQKQIRKRRNTTAAHSAAR